MRPSASLLELLRFLLPARCLGCASPLPMDSPKTDRPALVCARCMAALRAPPWPRCARCHFPRGTGRVPRGGCLECAPWPDCLVGARTSAMLEPPADALVYALKYGGWRALADPMGRRMARLCRPPNADAVVVPVPTTPTRARQRGYNQAELLARAYAERLAGERIPARFLDALLRVRDGSSQVSLAPDQRRRNVAGSFRPAPGARSALRGRPILLVDDVLTTGATAAAAAEALERAGAAGVTVVTFARAFPGREHWVRA